MGSVATKNLLKKLWISEYAIIQVLKIVNPLKLQIALAAFGLPADVVFIYLFSSYFFNYFISIDYFCFFNLLLFIFYLFFFLGPGGTSHFCVCMCIPMMR